MNFFLKKEQLADLKPEDISLIYKRLTVKIFMVVGFPVMVLFFLSHLVRGNYIESGILFLTSVTVLITFLSIRKNGGAFSEAKWLIFAYRFMGLLLAILFLYIVGVEQDFSTLHWCYLFPIFLVFALGSKEAFIWVVLFFTAVSFVVYAFDFNFVSPQVALNHKIRFLLSFFMVSVILLIISYVRHRNLVELYERQQALKFSEKRYKDAFEQNKALLREVHHRVKNNLQVISGLLYLQSGKINDAEAKNLVMETRNRIRSMAMVYETLYTSKNFAFIDMESYTRKLFTYLLSEYHKNGSNIRIFIDARGMFLGIDLAVPCCLIFQELISNALKHAFTSGKENEIRISLKKSGKDIYSMGVGDNGVGLPEDVDFHHPKTLGLQLISSLVAQMGGTFRVVKNNGTLFSMNFPTPSQGKNHQ